MLRCLCVRPKAISIRTLAKPIAGVFELFCSGFDHLVAGNGGEDIGQGGECGNVAATEQHHDGGGESDRAAGGAAYESDLIVVLCHVEGLTGLAEDLLLECEVHDWFTRLK